MAEIWKQIPGFENYYQISNLGRVRSLYFGKQKVLKIWTHTNRGSYGFVHLYGGKKPRTFAVARLVLLAFVGPKPRGLEIRHLNGAPTDERLRNLKYGTHRENEADKLKHGRRLLGEAHPNSKLTKRAVIRIRRLKGKMSQRQIAKSFAVTVMAVNRILVGKSWTHV
jgi:hypothetical protein